MSLTEATTANSAGLTLEEVRTILLRHNGSIRRLAEELKITDTTVSQVLRGRCTSKRVMKYATRKALELLQQEGEDAA